MITREELLEKGLDEKMVDEIFASFDSGSSLSAVEELSKALDNKDGQKGLFKADDDSDDDDKEGKDEYDAEYMKKNMKRYMKENEKACKKMIEDMGTSEKKMAKAIEDINPDSDGVVVAMDNLAPFLDSMTEYMSSMSKAFSDISERVSKFEANQIELSDIVEKSGRVQVAISETLQKAMSTPSGRKGMSIPPATELNSQATTTKPVQNEQIIYSTLSKAIAAGDRQAGSIMSVFEASNKNVKMLNASERAYIANLINGGK